jgi:glycerophosphoryl diester phosphodiesterase
VYVKSLPILLALVFVFINYKFFSHSVTNSFYSGSYKVWAHRGYYKQFPENSIESLSEAFNRGARGVELDIFFDQELQNFIISHDIPDKSVKNELLTLEKVFSSLGKRGYFWIDFKQLESVHDINLVVDKMEKLLTKFQLFEKVIIESPNGFLLRKFSQRGIHTSYWIQLSSIKVLTLIKDCAYRVMIAFSNFSAISMDYRDYGDYIRKSYSHLPIHLFTVNDKEEASELIKNCAVKVVLSDEDYYYLTHESCL